MLPFLPALPAAAWPYVLVSSLLNGLYFILMAEAYAHGGVALAYPLMRGVAPMMTLVRRGCCSVRHCRPPPGSALRRSAAAWCCWRGAAAMPTRRAAVRFALANAVVIAAYTLNDAVGVRISQAPLAYTLWLFPLSAVPTLLWLRRSTPLRRPSLARGRARARWRRRQHRRLCAGAVGDDPGAGRTGGGAARDRHPDRRGAGAAVSWRAPGRRGWGGAVAIAAGAAILRLAPG